MEFPDKVVSAIEEWRHYEYHASVDGLDDNVLLTSQNIVRFRLGELGMNEQAIDFFLFMCCLAASSANYSLITAEELPKYSHLRRLEIGNCLFLRKEDNYYVLICLD